MDDTESCCEKCLIKFEELKAPYGLFQCGASVRVRWSCPACGDVEVAKDADPPPPPGHFVVGVVFWAAVAAVVIVWMLR